MDTESESADIELSERLRASVEDKTAKTNSLDSLMTRYDSLMDGGIGRAKFYTHNIQMENTKPHKGKTYPIPKKYFAEVKRQIKDMEKANIIKKAATQYINPLVAVVKPNGKIRICLDARTINDKMKNDHAQPPTIDEVLGNIGQRRIFSKLDIVLTKLFGKFLWTTIPNSTRDFYLTISRTCSSNFFLV